jgi:sugar phosphate isomerase/epimerase
MPNLNRRNFLTALPAISLARAVPFSEDFAPKKENRFRLSLNAYSFNDMLMKKKISKAEILEFCANTGFDAVDMTGYYFSTYPATPSDAEIFDFKRKAHALGIEISGTGVRNEFSYSDSTALGKEIDTVLRWIEVAAKMGAPVLRVFTAKQYSTGDERKRVNDRILFALNKCIEKAAAYGIVLGIQNHNDFLRTADECHELIGAVNSQWLGLVVDTGNFIASDPYEEIRKSLPLAVNWQVKEKLLINGVQTPMDLKRLCSIIQSSNYRGNVPIETLGMNDPLNEVPVFFDKVKKHLLG